MLRAVKRIATHDLFLCFSSALFLALPFLNPNLFIFSWFSFLPFLSVLENKSKIKVFVLSYFTGVVFWSLTVYWLVYVTLLGQILLVLYLSLYFGFFGILSHRFLKNKYSVFLLPAAWVLSEFLRSHLLTGFPWALLGYSQYLNLFFIQIADFSGVWGVSFLIVMVNAALYSVRFLRPTEKRRLTLLIALLLSAVFFYGYNKVERFDTGMQEGYAERVKVSVIQPNILQEEKWDSSKRGSIMSRYFEVTSLAGKQSPDLIVWPEAALPVVLEEGSEFLSLMRSFVKESGLNLLFGAVTLRNNFYYNSAILLSDKGEILGKYDKLHLVPFGEYVPLRNILSFVDAIAPIGDISRGSDYVLFDSIGKFGVLICFEDVFPHLSRNFVRRGAGFLINITNDAWFGNSPEAFQHLAASVLRAVENRVYLVRSANTGVSAFVSPSGRVFSSIKKEGKEIFVSGYSIGEIFPLRKGKTLYSRLGDFLPAVCFLIISWVLYAQRRQ